jgi:hypothetical protein
MDDQALHFFKDMAHMRRLKAKGPGLSTGPFA